MRMQPILSVMLAGLALGGCHTLQIQSRTDPHTIAQYAPGGGVRSLRRDGPSLDPDICPLVATARDDHRGAIDLDCFRFPEDRGPPGARVATGQPAYFRAVEDGLARNRLASILLKQSDDICVIELSQLRANEATVNTGLSTLTTTLSAAATIVGGKLAKSILSGTASAISGTQSHINVQVYRNQISEAVAQAIEVDRARQRDLITGKYGEGVKTWTVDDAIRMVNAYHGTCSFYKGLELLLMAPGQEKVREAYEADRRELLAAYKEIALKLAGAAGAAATDTKQKPADAGKAAAGDDKK